MKRRIVQHGPATLTVSLPADWVKAFSLKKGDEITVEQVPQGLLISAGQTEGCRSCEIDLRGVQYLGRHFLSVAFRLGYTEMLVRYEPEQMEEVRELAHRELFDFEIVEEGDAWMRMRRVSVPSAEEFKIIFRRFCYLLQHIVEQAGSPGTAQRVATLERLVNLCLSIVNSHGQKTFFPETALYYIIKQLYHIGEKYRSIDGYLVAFGADEVCRNLLAEMVILVKTYHELLFSFDLVAMNQLAQRISNLRENMRRLLRTKVEHPMLVVYIYTAVRQLHSLIDPTLAIHFPSQ
jgi:hypothetical protein